MKYLILSTVLCSAVSVMGCVQPAVAAETSPIQSIVVQQGSEVSGEGQALLDLFKKDVLPSELVLSAQPSIAAQESGYVVTVPQSTLPDEQKTVVPEYQVVFNRSSDFNGYPAYEADLTDVAQLSPMLYQLMEQNDMSLQRFSYKIVFVPALNISIGQGMTIDRMVMKNEGKDVLVIDKILEKASVTPLPGQMAKVERATGISQFFLNTQLGSVRMDQLTSLFEIPSISLNALSLENIWSVKEARVSSDISNLRITSMLLPVQEVRTNVALNTSFKQTSDMGLMDMTLNLSFKDIAVAQKIPDLDGKLPTYMTLSVSVPNLDVKQIQQIVNLNQEIANEETAPERLTKAEKELDQAMNQLMSQAVVDIKEMALGSEEYSVALNGVLNQKDKTFKGTLTVINFDFISPEGTVDEAACDEARRNADALMEKMAQSQDNSLFDQTLAAQLKASQLCEAEPGVLDALRPYMAPAKRTLNAKGQTVDSFDVEYNSTGLSLNGTPVLSDAVSEEAVEETETTVETAPQPNEPLIP